MTLQGLSVIVTGAGSGIGRAIADHAARSGAHVTITGRRVDALEETAERIAGPVEIVAADLGRGPQGAATVVAAAIARFGRVDGLVNNAGLARFGPIDEVELDALDAMFAVNVRGPVELIQSALPQLRANKGSIVNVSSVGGVLSMPGRSFYGATKAALNSLTRSLAKELAPHVRVNGILPGPVDTPMWTDLGMTEAQTEILRSNLLADTPMGRFGEVDEVARWVCCLLDPDFSGWMTGALIPVDGGRTT